MAIKGDDQTIRKSGWRNALPTAIGVRGTQWPVFFVMSYPQHLVVRPGKAEADTTEPIPTFFEHVDALRADQVQLNCKLTKERVANCQARSDLAAAQHAYERACHLTHKTMKDIADYRLQLSKTQLEVAEAQKGTSNLRLGNSKRLAPVLTFC